ncbi:Myb-like DNA-binding protein myb-1 [Trichoderma asperellum]|uniref:Myb-like DNA-binding protein myb-1 n=1 Tax=Trichoderma asperellum TaxID=101201 RepID=A0A6V8QS31_TRIAP|nr:hypothetical protein LI328DRAFT_138891 [Trichoderma asperelloides]GFP55190.1 Myb-like DNA-binding protein myb-1 [Trichoderma asperellum]
MSDTAGPVVQREVDFIPIEELVAMTPTDISRVAMTGKFPQRRGPWSPDESFRLVTLINKTGAQNWVTVASFMGSRNAKQCRERYHQNLDPSLRHDPISEDEAAKIMDLYHKYGSAWARIAEQLPGRSDNAIKNYVNGLVNKTRRAEGRLAGQHPRSRTAARRRSSAAAATSAVLAATSLSTPSSGNSAVESPTLSDMTESDSGNNYSLSSSWGQFPASSTSHTSQRVSSEWYRPLSQSPELAQSHIHHAAPHGHPTFRVSPYGQTQPRQNGYAQQQVSRRPMSRSSEPSSSRRLSTDLAKFSLSSRRSSRDSNMFTPSPTLSVSAATLPQGRRADPRMAIGNLLG